MNAKDRIQPPPYKPTEQEHKIAYLTHMLDEICWSYLLSIKMRKKDYDTYDLGKKYQRFGGRFLNSKQEVLEDMMYELQDFFDRAFKEDAGENEPWENILPYEEFKQTWGGEYLAEPHQGDCIAFPAPCVRCHAEEKYGQNSITWKDKYEGHRLATEYYKPKE